MVSYLQASVCFIHSFCAFLEVSHLAVVHDVSELQCFVSKYLVSRLLSIHLTKNRNTSWKGLIRIRLLLYQLWLLHKGGCYSSSFIQNVCNINCFYTLQNHYRYYALLVSSSSSNILLHCNIYMHKTHRPAIAGEHQWVRNTWVHDNVLTWGKYNAH